MKLDHAARKIQNMSEREHFRRGHTMISRPATERSFGYRGTGSLCPSRRALGYTHPRNEYNSVGLTRWRRVPWERPDDRYLDSNRTFAGWAVGSNQGLTSDIARGPKSAKERNRSRGRALRQAARSTRPVLTMRSGNLTQDRSNCMTDKTRSPGAWAQSHRRSSKLHPHRQRFE